MYIVRGIVYSVYCIPHSAYIIQHTYRIVYTKHFNPYRNYAP